ncbi:MAG: ABC transporter substrate-binding protein [Bacteroidetes bacterium]|nr:MAG: ABC transporter substrate-binding protein [Bacteroidota bacterium]TAG90635.1 MAG: ABC transporter substrate-binding protein [Bacteroidota bacterium]
MLSLKIGGVPEHFNMPWHWGIEQKFFQKKNLDLHWIDYHAGTGAMAQDLREGKLDVAVVLTEGITADILKGNPSKILQMYVCSPLVWGIHTPLQYNHLDEIQHLKTAISRFGSGSHLMALLDAKQRNWDIEKMEFETTNGLKGGIQKLTENTCGRFLWEKLMTKSFVDKGLIKCLGECPTPWGAFVVAVRNDILSQFPTEINVLCQTINHVCHQFITTENITQKIVQKFNLSEFDVQQWLASVHWATEFVSPVNDIEKVLEALTLIGQDTKNMKIEDFI